MELKTAKELIELLMKLVRETKNVYTEKDLAIFRHVNSIDVTAKTAEQNLDQVRSGKEKIYECIGKLRRDSRQESRRRVKWVL